MITLCFYLLTFFISVGASLVELSQSTANELLSFDTSAFAFQACADTQGERIQNQTVVTNVKTDTVPAHRILGEGWASKSSKSTDLQNSISAHPECQPLVGVSKGSAQSDTQLITITNAITPDMLEYNYWGTHSPESFSITINGAEVKTGETLSIPATQTSLEVQYNYSFAKGLYKGTKISTHQINDNIKTAEITFSWNNPTRVSVSNGTCIRQEAAMTPAKAKKKSRTKNTKNTSHTHNKAHLNAH